MEAMGGRESEMIRFPHEENLPINILLRRDRFGDSAGAIFIDMRPKRKLDENATNSVVVGELLDEVDDLLRCSCFWDFDVVELDANFLSGFSFHTNIGG